MGRPQHSRAVIVQKTVGEKMSAIDKETITTTEKTISFRANLISYILNDGSYDVTLTFFNDGLQVGQLLLEAGYGLENTYLTIDEVKAVTNVGDTVIKGVGVY